MKPNFLINSMLKDKIEKKNQFKKKRKNNLSQPVLTP